MSLSATAGSARLREDAVELRDAHGEPCLLGVVSLERAGRAKLLCFAEDAGVLGEPRAQLERLGCAGSASARESFAVSVVHGNELVYLFNDVKRTLRSGRRWREARAGARGNAAFCDGAEGHRGFGGFGRIRAKPNEPSRSFFHSRGG